VCDDVQKFVKAWPRDGPLVVATGQIAQCALGRVVKVRFGAMRVDKNIGVDGNHLRSSS
jgi:hypothetical protein